MQSFNNLLNVSMHPFHNYSNGHQYYNSSSSTSSATSSNTSKSSNMTINSSFIKDLIDLNNASESRLQSNSPKSSRNLQQQHQHHHHSIQELIRHFGKKVHIWRNSNHIDNYRRNSCSNSYNKYGTDDEFRGRSKSLDCATKRPIYLSDCESTYRIYDKILLEGMFFFKKNME